MNITAQRLATKARTRLLIAGLTALLIGGINETDTGMSLSPVQWSCGARESMIA
jgi:hypothetical protein